MSAEDFVRIWTRAKNLEDVAKALGVLTTTASVRACRYRRAGVNLKKFKKGVRPNVDRLNRIVAKA